MLHNRKILTTALILIAMCIIMYPTILLVRYFSSKPGQNTPTPTAIGTLVWSGTELSARNEGQQNVVSRQIPFQSVVLITAFYTENGSRKEGWTGSGTFISPDGLILTNAHVVLPALDYPIDLLTIAPTLQDDRKPDPAYLARVVQADPGLDLAVIRITSDLSGNPLVSDGLHFPAVELGDSDRLKLGDPLSILGYPGIGGDTITLTSGEVAGFTGEAGYGNRAYIKTSAAIAGGNSGGLAADVTGALVGIPTLLGSGTDSGVVDCRILADTNNDGFIDQDDTCIPTGGFINSLRPVNLAKPLIEAALRGEERVIQQAVQQPTPGNAMDGLLFTDDFSDINSGWTIYGDDDGYVGYADGSYLIGITRAGQVLSGASGIQGSDISIKVNAVITQSTGSGGIGLICRQQSDASYYYAMEIREDGFASIWKNAGNTEIQLTGWQYVQPVGPNSVITLTGSCVGQQLIMGINGRTILSTVDSDYVTGDAGLLASTSKTGGFVVSYDNFQVSAGK